MVKKHKSDKHSKRNKQLDTFCSNVILSNGKKQN
ncbi:MAG: hypothetical protein R3A12_09050 [Ignavibacteria bacterium]